MQRRIIYDSSNSIYNKIIIDYEYQDSYIAERKSVYAKSIFNPIQTTKIEKYVTGEITYDTTFYTTYDAHGNFEQQIRQGRDQNDKIIVFTKINYRYNNLGLKTGKSIYENFEDGLKKVSSTQFEYDSNKRLVRKTSIATDDNPWNYIVTYKYNLNGDCIEQYFLRNDDGYPFVRKSFSYNDKNQMIAYTHENKMKKSDQFRSIDTRYFEYDKDILTKITKNGKVEMQIKLDDFGNIIERFSSFASLNTRSIMTFDYSIPQSNIRNTLLNKAPSNSYKFTKVDEYGLKYYNVKVSHSHGIISQTTFRINDEEEKLSRRTLYKYRSL